MILLFKQIGRDLLGKRDYNIKRIPEGLFLEVSENASIYNQVVCSLDIPLPSPSYLMYSPDKDLYIIPDTMSDNFNRHRKKNWNRTY